MKQLLQILSMEHENDFKSMLSPVVWCVQQILEMSFLYIYLMFEKNKYRYLHIGTIFILILST
jgi:hypothetical protein